MTEFISIKPKRIQAVQWTGKNLDECLALCATTTWTNDFRLNSTGTEAQLYVEANRAWLDLEEGEWIAKDSLGFYPIKDSMFRETYRVATRQDQDLPVGTKVTYIGSKEHLFKTSGKVQRELVSLPHVVEVDFGNGIFHKLPKLDLVLHGTPESEWANWSTTSSYDDWKNNADR